MTTPFVPGNQLWRRRFTHGAPRKYETAEELMAECVKYFEWLESEDAHLKEEKAFCSNGEIKVHNQRKMRAATHEGLCLFLGISRAIWYEWAKNRADLLDIIAATDDHMREWNLAGSSAGMLNSNIIARYLGLVDQRKDTEVKEVNMGDMSTDDLKKLLIEVLSDKN